MQEKLDAGDNILQAHDHEEEVDERTVQKRNPSKFYRTPFTDPIQQKKRKTNAVARETDHGKNLIAHEAAKQHLRAEGEDGVGLIPQSGYIQYVGSKDEI